MSFVIHGCFTNVTLSRQFICTQARFKFIRIHRTSKYLYLQYYYLFTLYCLLIKQCARHIVYTRTIIAISDEVQGECLSDSKISANVCRDFLPRFPSHIWWSQLSWLTCTLPQSTPLSPPPPLSPFLDFVIPEYRGSPIDCSRAYEPEDTRQLHLNFEVWIRLIL